MINKKLNKLFKSISPIVFVILFMILLILYLFIHSSIHELGHIIFGFLNNLIRDGTITKFKINSVENPLFPFIKIPQQTQITNGKGSTSFIFGGMIFSVLIITIISLICYNLSKKKHWFLLIIPVLIQEVFGNYFCGTDNLTNNPLPLCKELNLITFTVLSVFLFVGILWVILLNNYNKILIFLKKRVHPNNL